jgi:mRNA interferase MazF
MTQTNYLDSGDIVIIALPDHRPRGHEQQGTRPVVIVGIPEGETRYLMIMIAPLTTQTGSWSTNNANLYPRLESGTGGLSQPSIVLLLNEQGSGRGGIFPISPISSIKFPDRRGSWLGFLVQHRPDFEPV